MMEELLNASQFCGVSGSTIFEAMASLREAFTQEHMIRVSLCVLSFDFQTACDRITHQYPFTILEAMDLVTGLWNESRACMRKPLPPSK